MKQKWRKKSAFDTSMVWISFLHRWKAERLASHIFPQHREFKKKVGLMENFSTGVIFELLSLFSLWEGSSKGQFKKKSFTLNDWFCIAAKIKRSKRNWFKAGQIYDTLRELIFVTRNFEIFCGISNLKEN